MKNQISKFIAALSIAGMVGCAAWAGYSFNGSAEQSGTAEYQEQKYYAEGSGALDDTYVTELEYINSISETATGSGTEKYSIDELKSMFPAGRYWNGGNALSTTGTGCSHGADGSNISNCNNYGGWAYQCIGYAMQLSSLYTGENPLSYNLYEAGGAVDHLETGSIVRFNVNSSFDHAILITGNDGNGNYYYTDANYDNKCGIRWNGVYSVEQLRALLNRKLNSKWNYGSQNSVKGFVLTVNHDLKNISDCDITVTGPDLLKNESGPAVSVSYNGKKLTASDYGYYTSSVDGNGTVTIYGRGSYTGTKEIEFTAVYGEIAECSADYSDMVAYAPLKSDPKITLTNKYGKTVSASEYYVEYDDSYEPGEHTMTVKARSNSRIYRGSRTFTYTIQPADINGEYVSIFIANEAQDAGSSTCPEISLSNRYTQETLQNGTDYTVANEISGDSGVVTITGKNSYTGTYKAEYKVIRKESETTSQNSGTGTKPGTQGATADTQGTGTTTGTQSSGDSTQGTGSGTQGTGTTTGTQSSGDGTQGTTADTQSSGDSTQGTTADTQGTGTSADTQPSGTGTQQVKELAQVQNTFCGNISYKNNKPYYAKYTFNSVDGAEKYEIYRADYNGETNFDSLNWKLIATTASTEYLDYNVFKGMDILIKVRALSGDVKGAFSTEYEVDLRDNTVDLKAKCSNGKVSLSWDSYQRAKCYELIIRDMNDKILTYDYLPADSTTYVIDNLEIGKTYKIEVLNNFDNVLHGEIKGYHGGTNCTATVTVK